MICLPGTESATEYRTDKKFYDLKIFFLRRRSLKKYKREAHPGIASHLPLSIFIELGIHFVINNSINFFFKPQNLSLYLSSKSFIS